MSMLKRITADTANMLRIHFRTARKSKLLQVEHGGSPGELDKVCPGGSKLILHPIPPHPQNHAQDFCPADAAWRRSCMLVVHSFPLPGCWTRGVCTGLVTDTWHLSSQFKGSRMYWRESSEGPQKWLRNWSICCGMLEHLNYLGQFSLEKEGSGGFYQYVPILDGGAKKIRRWRQTLLTSTWWQDKRQWALFEIQETPFKHNKKAFFSLVMGNQTLAQVAQRGCGVSVLGNVKNRTETTRFS